MKKGKWDERYSGPDYVFGTDPNEFLASAAERIPKGRVLCLGEGEGRNAVYLAEWGYDVVAVDLSEVGLKKAVKLAAERGVEIMPVVSDVADFTIDRGAWAGIVSIFFHVPKAQRTRMYRDVVNGLKPGGVFVLEAFTPRQLEFNTGGPSDVDLLYTLDDLKSRLRGLEFEVGRELDRTSQKNGPHEGDTCAVVQVVAVKSDA